MANVQISALPSTTTTTFNDWVIKNNSGETTTSKVQLKNMLGMTSLNGNNAIQSSSWLTQLGTTATTESAIAIGNGAEATSPYSIAIGYQAYNSNRDGGRDYYTCIGYRTRAVQGGTAFGKEAKALGADSTAIGQSAEAFGNGGFAVGNGALNQSFAGVALGKDAYDQGNNYGTVVGFSSQVFGGDYQTAIGYNNTTTGQEGTSIGSQNNSLGNLSTTVGANNDVYSGQTNGTAVGVSNIISGGTSGVAIGYLNNVGHTDAVVLGYSQTSVYTATTHVDNLYVKRIYSFNTINAGTVAGAIDVDLSLGSLFFFSISGDVSVNFINITEGQKVQFWVDNLGSHNVTGMTITGGGDVYAKGGNVNPTSNQITGYYGTIVNGNMFLDEHLNFQVV